MIRVAVEQSSALSLYIHSSLSCRLPRADFGPLGPRRGRRCRQRPGVAARPGAPAPGRPAGRRTRSGRREVAGAGARCHWRRCRATSPPQHWLGPGFGKS